MKTYASLEEKTYSPFDIARFKFAPITSCNVERSFSRYKSMFACNRRRFTFENLKMSIIINCFYANWLILSVFRELHRVCSSYNISNFVFELYLSWSIMHIVCIFLKNICIFSCIFWSRNCIFMLIPSDDVFIITRDEQLHILISDLSIYAHHCTSTISKCG